MATNRTVREVIERSLRLINVLAVGETAKAADTSTALKVMQDLLASKAGSIFVPFIIQETIILVVGQRAYTIGEVTGADKSSQAPEQVTEAWIRDSGGYDSPVKVVDERNFNAITSKTTPGSPEMLWYNATSPNGTVNLYPVPDTADTLYMSTLKTLAKSTSLTAKLLDAGVPEAYHRWLSYTLAVDLAPEYGMEASATVIANSISGENDILALNLARTISPAIIEVGTGSARGSGDSILNF
jgi:hypothetical protein